jgi:hypothetical protein
MKDWMFVALIFFVIIFFVIRHFVLENKRNQAEEKEESKQLVFHFLRNQFPKSVNLLDVSAYSRINFEESQEILVTLVMEKLIVRQKYRHHFFLRELNEYRYCPPIS